jgi:ribosome-associated protein
MRGRDEETGEFLAPSRSQRKRDADAVLDLAQQLVDLSPTQLAKLPLPDAIVAAVADTRRITSNSAHKRQLHYLAKLMRREDEETLEPIRQTLNQDSASGRRETAKMHRIEGWRERLLSEGDSALGELVDQHPQLDRQHLRTLIRSARLEREKNKPPRAFRDLFQLLKALEDAAEGENTSNA